MLHAYKLKQKVNDNYFSTEIPWAYISSHGEGIVVQKDGVLQRTFTYRGPDLEASAGIYLQNLALHISDSVKRLGAGWGMHFEVQRFATSDYPGGTFNRLAAFIVDKEREQSFKAYGRHYESSYFLTFSYAPPKPLEKKLTNLFFSRNEESTEGDAIKQDVEQFERTTDDIVGILSDKMIIAPLNNEQTLQYLHSSISRNWHYIKFPQEPIFLDRILPDQPLDISLTMKLGEDFIPIVGVMDFPMETWPAIFDELNKVKLEYRWVSRYICLDKEEALKRVDKAQRAHKGNQVGWLQSFVAATSKEPVTRVNGGAVVKELDASQAQVDIDTDEVSLGLYTSNVMVWDRDLGKAKEKAALVKKVIQSVGFVCKDESMNAFEAFKSMMPGQMYSNVRMYPVLSSTLSHILPLSAIWAGASSNEFLGEITGSYIPHLICSTDYGTPFFLNLNFGDVGHATVWGPTGAGKSTLTNLISMQTLKYPDSQVITLDKGRSARQPTMACGGKYYEPGTSGVSFQPFRELESEADCTWAMEFVETLLAVQNVEILPKMSTAITEGINLLKGMPVNQRTLTTFCQGVNYLDPLNGQPVIVDALRPFCLEGKYGHIFDQAETSISLDTRWLTFEMERLMEMGETCVAPALSYLFHFIEKMFDGRFTLLVLDEAWLFLRHPLFQAKIEEWLKTLRKKKVFVIFATQDISDAVRSPLCSTLLQQCHTKIFLADPTASTPALAENYRVFGLTDSEISAISRARMKRDYFYKSPIGTRLFQLDLGKVTLGIIGSPDHDLLNELQKEYQEDHDHEYVKEILSRKGIPFQHLIPEEMQEA